MRNFKDIILEKLKVSIKNYHEDPKIIWDKILEHRFFQFRPRLLIDLVGEEYSDEIKSKLSI